MAGFTANPSTTMKKTDLVVYHRQAILLTQPLPLLLDKFTTKIHRALATLSRPTDLVGVAPEPAPDDGVNIEALNLSRVLGDHVTQLVPHLCQE